MLFVSSGVFLAIAGKNCGLDRLYPSGVTADSVYSSSFPAEHLIDGSLSTHWYSADGDTTDNVYFDFSNDVDIKHIWIMEGSSVIYNAIAYNGAGAYLGRGRSDSNSGYSHIDIWFDELITDRLGIWFSGSSGNFLTVTEVSFWGCNLTSTAPTAIPTLSPSQMPTNSTPTVAPTIYPSLSPTKMPTNMTSRAPTVVPTMSPSDMPTNSAPTVAPTIVPTVSPSQIPTSSILTVLPTVSLTDMPSTLPTMSPTDMPTNLLTVSPTQMPIGTNDSNNHVIIAIKVTELLGVIILLLLAVVIFMCIQFRIRKRSQSVHPEAMPEKPDMADNKTGNYTQQNAVGNWTEMTLYNSADRVGQTDSTRYNAKQNVEENSIQTNMTLNIGGEKTRSEVKVKEGVPNLRGDIRFALDKVRSDGEICVTEGGIEIGPQQSDI